MGWAGLGEPPGSKPAKRPPVLVIQANPYNDSRLNTTLAAVITSNANLVDRGLRRVLCQCGTPPHRQSQFKIIRPNGPLAQPLGPIETLPEQDTAQASIPRYRGLSGALAPAI